MRDAELMVLCAGAGSRLGALTEFLPKPLVPIGDRPALSHLLAHAQQCGIGQVAINTSHRAEYFSDYSFGGVAVSYRHEPAVLGTAGGVRNAESLLADTCVIWNGDILTKPPLSELLGLAPQSGVVLLVAACPEGDAGTVGLDDKGRVVRLRSERFGAEIRGVNYVGIMATTREARRQLPKQGCLIGDFCLPLLRDGHSVDTLRHAGSWTDVGSASAYASANQNWLTETGRTYFKEQGASVAVDVRLDRSVVLEGARVFGSGVVERCIIWRSASVEAPLADAIVLPDGRIISTLQLADA